MGSLLGFSSREVDHPVFRPGLTAIQRAMTFPVGAAAGNLRPSEPGENPLPAVIGPLAEEVNTPSLEPATPHEKTARGGPARGRRPSRLHRSRGAPALGDLGRARELGLEPRGLLTVGGELRVHLLAVGVVVGEGGMDAG